MKKKHVDRASFKETWKSTIRGYKIWWSANPKILISSAVCGMVDALAPYVGIYLSARIINEIAGARDTRVLTQIVLTALISAAVISMLSAGLNRWKNCQHSMSWDLKNKIFSDKLMSMDFNSVDDPRIHDLISQDQQNQTSGGWGIVKLLWNFDTLICSVMSIVGAVALTVSLFILRVPAGNGWLAAMNNPLFSVLIIAVMLAVTFVTPLFSVKAGSYWVKLADENKMGNRLFTFWFGVLGFDNSRAMDVRIYRQDIFGSNNLEKCSPFTAKSKLAKAAHGPIGSFSALSAAVSQVFTGIVYIFVCLKAYGGAFGVGSVTQYIASITALSGGVSSLISTLGDMRNNAAFLRTTFEFLDTPNDMYQGSLAVEKRSDKKYEIEFRNVSFKYPSLDTYALRDISLKFNIGQRLAVVGMNGSGKTTFIKLLCRLYDPTEGEILLNGINIRKYDYKEYMSIFSVVFQDFKLLSFCLGQNVAAKMAYEANRAAVCLDGVGFSGRLKEFPAGLETNLYKDFDEKGVDISGGEAQKIALARALYKDAAFIILDEPTAALDPVAEFEVYSKMNEIVGKKTAVFISHRLSSCRFCQNIAVFHEGKVVQRGSHDELVADENGKYYKLWQAQAQYYTT